MNTIRKRKFIMYGLLIAIALTTVAYATLQTVLTISGTVVKKGGTWDIHFANVSDSTITGDASMAKPSLINTTNLNFSVTLAKPLDKAEFTVDVVNGGSIDAALSSVVLTGATEAKAQDITYTVTYADGKEIKQYDALRIDQTRTLKVIVSYDDVSSLSAEDVTLNLGLTLIYVQAEEDSYQTEDGESMGVVDSSLAAAPDLLNNSLTPVVYNGTNWVVADTTKQWYNYSQQEWANAVILEDGVTKNVGDTVLVPTASSTATEVKAMYVWIPRYEYKIEGQYGTHTNGTIGTQELPGEIEVNFISKSQTTPSSGYIIHPAFQWDNDSNGTIIESENISGIWVGKFETSTSTTDTCYSSFSETNCTSDKVTPYILPNVKALTYQNVSNQFITAQKLGTYLSNSSNTDSHMMKNSEWGAVAYLSQSKYGKYGNSMYTGANKEVYKNDSYSEDIGVFTGRSMGTPSVDGNYPSGTCYYDNITDRGSGTGSCGGGASTTGNIYGVYDMSGGSNEYVMGSLPTGFAPAGFSSKPADKYFDAYTAQTSTTACNGGICYGQALSETSRWYGDYNFFSTDHSWLTRGGSSLNYIDLGVFFFRGYDGTAGQNGEISFRSVLLATGA